MRREKISNFLSVHHGVLPVGLYNGEECAGRPREVVCNRTLHSLKLTMSKKVLLLGGAGFIGSHLAERLLEEGHQVAILDDLSTGRLENIEHLAGHPRFSATI